MSRLGKSLISDTELLSVDRIAAEIDAVTPDAVAELAGVLLAPEKLSAAGIGPSEERFRDAVRRVKPELSGTSGGVKVALLGHEGKVGRVLKPALEEAGHEVKGIGRDDAVEVQGLDAADPLHAAGRRLRHRPRLPRAGRAEHRRHDRPRTGGARRPRAARAASRACALFVAPNFAVGAVLMIRLAAEAAPLPAAGGDRRAAPRDEAGRALGNGEGDRRGHGRRRADPLRPPPGPRRPPGGAPLGAGRAADDPPRRVLARGVRPGRPAGARTAPEPAARPDSRPRAACSPGRRGKIGPCSARS